MQKRTKLRLKDALAVLLKSFKISLQVKSRASLAVCIIGFGAAFLPALISSTLKNFTNLIQSIFGMGTENLPEAFKLFAVLSALYIVQLLYNSLRSYFTQEDSLHTRTYIKRQILRHTCTVRYQYLENDDDFREKILFAEGDTGYRVAESMGRTINLLQYLITFISIVIVLSAVDAWIVVILFATCIPAVILAYMQNDQEYRNKTKWMKENAMVAHYYQEMNLQPPQNDVRFFELLDYLKKLWRELKDVYINKKNKMTRKHVLFNSIADILRNSVYIVILLLTARQIFQNPAIGLGAFMLVFTLASQFQEATAKILIGVVQFASDISYMKDFFDLDKLEHENIDSKAEPYEKSNISFRNVDFSYPNTDRQILKDINVQIKQGEKIAIVGENGSGKTTFVNLLCGLYNPDNGKIEIGGNDIYANLSKTRRSISAIFQEFGRYETTIRENITVSDPAKQSEDRALKDLTIKLDAYEFIENQANGFDEIVGTLSEKGNNLSGGQWQKVALARAAYRDNAKIMVLDEPTAALDPIAEASLYENFKEITGDRTTILISHRLGITKLVDRILVFDDGRIVEDGTHSELLAANGLYARMYNAQAQWYNAD